MITHRGPLAAFLLLSSSAWLLASPKISPDLRRGSGEGEIDVIVQFASEPSHRDHERVVRRGGRFKGELGLIRAGLYSLPSQTVSALASDPNVVYVSPDRQVEALLDFTNDTVGASYALSKGFDGTGVGIAVIDSGVLEVKDLLSPGSSASNASRVVFSQSFVPRVTTAVDQYGHGTHVAGIAAGNANASTGSTYIRSFRGIAPNAKIINLRVLDAKGLGTDTAVIAAIDRAIQLKNQYNIRVMNISLGRPVYESYTKDPLCRAVERAWKAGIVVVVAAGNEGRNRSQGTEGYATITSPANHPLVITVGAMKAAQSQSRADDRIASYSSKGPTLLDHVVKPDLVAPGNRVISLVASKSLVANNSTTNRILYSYYQQTSSKSYSADYYKLSGTSMAAPMVAGAAAAMLHNDWSLSPDTIKARLMRTATKSFPAYSTATDEATGQSYTAQYDVFTVGAGYLDLAAALTDGEIVPPGSTAASPEAVFDKATGTVCMTNVDTAIWGKAAIWGSAAVWGTTAVWGTNAFVEGQAAVWGSAAIWGSAAVWGTAATKGNAAVWGTAAIWGTGAKPTSETLKQLTTGEE
jgi:serine protease AprX